MKQCLAAAMNVFQMFFAAVVIAMVVIVAVVIVVAVIVVAVAVNFDILCNINWQKQRWILYGFTLIRY